MKNILQHLKTSGITTGSGMFVYAGGQYLNSTVADSLWRTILLFGLMTGMGVASKLVLDRISPKK